MTPAEERCGVAHIRRGTDVTDLAAMAKAVKAAEAIAHPGVEPAAANVALGPVTALMDRPAAIELGVVARGRWSSRPGTAVRNAPEAGRVAQMASSGVPRPVRAPTGSRSGVPRGHQSSWPGSDS